MIMENLRQPLLGMTLDQLRSLAVDSGLKPFVGNQIAHWLYVSRVTDIDMMTNLSLKARAMLAQHYCVGRQQPLMSVKSSDGTVKYLFKGVGDRDIESVMIPDGDRATLCVSSQAGCRMNCRFCMTGRQGFHSNLSTAAIINQVLSVGAQTPVRANLGAHSHKRALAVCSRARLADARRACMARQRHHGHAVTL